jgi:ABC-type cobalamin/Fe3+-siderophores transport system ATPase subunit
MLQVQNISFGYTDKAVIKNIDFTIEKTKCGNYMRGCESTLLKLMYGLHDLDEGVISWR